MNNGVYLFATTLSSSHLESDSCDVLWGQLDNTVEADDLSSYSQQSLQAILDLSAMERLCSSLDIYGNKARLSSLAGSNDTSSWLKAPPIPTLNLSIPSCEFIVAVRIWLDLPTFPSNPASMSASNIAYCNKSSN